MAHNKDNDAPQTLRVVVSGGGTGGHIFPAIAIANAVKRRVPDAEMLFVGAIGRMEMERVPAAGYEIVGLPVAGFDRRRLWRNAAVMIRLFNSMLRARKVLKRFKPHIAVGVGGYASGPTLKAAQRAGIPTLIQEQNSYAGVTNKLLAKKAGAICVAYEGMERFFPADRIVMTGNPVRKNILSSTLTQAEAKQQLGFDGSKPLVLVVGGSLGARTINQSIAASLDAVVKAGAQIMWQTGRLYEQECADLAAAHTPTVKATAFITDMATAYRAADIVVSRAGAGTISELQLLGKPAILVPSPNVAEDHQTKNALALSSRGAAVMIPDAEAPAEMASQICRLLDDKALRQSLAENVKAMALELSDEKIVDEIMNLISLNNSK